MRDFATVQDARLLCRLNSETLCIAPWGRDGLRIQSTHEPSIRSIPNALLELPAHEAQACFDIGEDRCVVTNGKIQARLDKSGKLSFFRNGDPSSLLEEIDRTCSRYSARDFVSLPGTWRIQARFKPRDGEMFFGLGQHQHGRLDQKGCVIELEHRNGETAIPFLVSNRGYGFLWNHAGTGRVELGNNGTRWVADSARQMDYCLMAGDHPADVMERYAERTGFPTAFPEWAGGFWQSKLRYRTQEELLAIAREYRKRDLPLSLIVIDFFHWTRMGDWKFDPADWPDPKAMVRELKDMGIRVMVSVWPTVSLASENYQYMRDRGMLARTERGVAVHTCIHDGRGQEHVVYYDPTHPEAREFIWRKIDDHYGRIGIRDFWLDSCEPETVPYATDNIRYHLGNAQEVGCLYPIMHQQGFYEGLRAAGETKPLLLCRSAWAGSQRYGVAVWSGDVESSWDSFRRQLSAGLNIGLSGIPWWTTDIGGFKGGCTTDPSFRELVIRWFQFSVFCPILRLHGQRTTPSGEMGENEAWSFGEEAYRIIREQLALRERLRPYLMKQMNKSARTGHPVMRPLFFDFPDDKRAWTIDDQYMFGPDILVAPVFCLGQRERGVYLPAGAVWRDAWTHRCHDGGSELAADAPIERIPVFVRGELGLETVLA